MPPPLAFSFGQSARRSSSGLRRTASCALVFLVGLLTGSACAQTAGSLEAAFNPASGPNASVNALLAQPDGKMIVSGLFTQIGTIPRKYLARLNANGTLDTSFTSGLTYASAPYVPWVLALQNDGKVLVVASYNFNRLNADGSADATFSASVNSPPQAVVAQPDGKILIGGSFSSVGSKAAHNLARLTNTGARDATFLATGTGVSGAVDTIGLQPDGKVLIGGEFTSVNGITRTRLARLTATGTLDTTFNPGSGADDTINLLVLQPDGKMLVGGNFAHFAGVACAGLVRVNADGTLDTTFVYNGAAEGTPTSLVVQSDGKVVLGGSFYTDGGNTWLSAFRLNSDGSTDTTFRAVVEAQISGTVALQADGKLVLGGGFATLNGAPRLGLARFNTDGTLDAPYNAGINLNGAVNAVAVRGDGTVVIGGAFTLVWWAARWRRRDARAGAWSPARAIHRPAAAAGCGACPRAILPGVVGRRCAGSRSGDVPRSTRAVVWQVVAGLA